MKLDLQSERLSYSPLTLKDVDISIDLWTNKDVVKYIDEPATEAEIHEEMPDAVKRGASGGIGVWCVADRETGEKLGSSYLLPMPTEQDYVDYSLIVMGQMPDADIELGYFLVPEAWGQGYATEICRRMLEFAFAEDSFDELVASVNNENLASKRVLEKCGFANRGRALCWSEDTPLYGITRDAWLEKR